MHDKRQWAVYYNCCIVIVVGGGGGYLFVSVWHLLLQKMKEIEMLDM